MSRPKQISSIRNKLDAVDNKILTLLAGRAELAVAMKKAKGTSPVYNPAREAEIISRLQAQNKSEFSDEAITTIFSEIIGASRNLERQLKVSFLGPKGTYSHEAAQKMFGSTSDFTPHMTLPDVLKAAETGNTDIALLPVENSSEGAVIQTHRLLLNTSLQISGEFTFDVQHCLLSNETSLNKITSVYAHPQALGQCREWLQLNLPACHLISETSNSQAALTAAKQPHSAAIGSKQAAQFANIPILVTGINDYLDNQTRFIGLSNYKPAPTGNDKTSIVCSVGDKVGALFELLSIFAKHKISLTRLESQPQPDRIYVFYIDFEGHRETPIIATALDQLAHEAKTCKILGSYPKVG